MLEEIERRVNEYISSISDDTKLLEALNEIDNAKTEDEIKRAIKTRYVTKESLDIEKSKLRKGITYRSPIARISSYQALNDEQSLEKNKIIAKLTLLERVGNMEPIIPYTASNNLLVQTIGNAFSSLELIHYGDIEKDEIINIQKEIMDILALLQQVEGQNSQVLEELKKEVLRFVNEGSQIEIPENITFLDDYNVRDIWNKFMGNKLPFDEFSRKCDRLYEKRVIGFNNQEAFEIMNDIADFANAKNKYNLRKGFITPQTNEKLRSDFNTLWNQLLYTYNLAPNRTGPSFDD